MKQAPLASFEYVMKCMDKCLLAFLPMDGRIEEALDLPATLRKTGAGIGNLSWLL